MNDFSYWEKTSFVGTADVVVIGSGLVGLSAALTLKQREPHLNVLVLERGFLPSGASTKNAGFACFGTVSEQLEVINREGEQEMMRLVDYKYRGLRRLRQNLGDTNIGYEQYGGYELFMDDENTAADICRGQVEHINNLLSQVIGTKDIYSVQDAQAGQAGFSGVQSMIFNRFEGQLHTGKMMRALLGKVYQTGTLVLNNCEVRQIYQQEKYKIIETLQGNFKAHKVILATNAFARQLIPGLDVAPGRGQVLITQPVPALKLKGTYHFKQGYYYFRNIDGRVLFGGGRELDFKTEETWDFGYTDKVQQQLLHYLQKVILPGISFNIEYWWSGIMGFGEQLSPIIKQVELGIYCAVRCNGMGVAMGSLVGEEAATLALNG